MKARTGGEMRELDRRAIQECGIPGIWLMEQAGAAAVGFNCVAADRFTASLVSQLRRYVKGPLLCKPNAGNPVITNSGVPHYPMQPEEFAQILRDCSQMGAALLGGCCGTTPDHIRAAKNLF